jgi:hypothetical protein
MYARHDVKTTKYGLDAYARVLRETAMKATQ